MGALLVRSFHVGGLLSRVETRTAYHPALYMKEASRWINASLECIYCTILATFPGFVDCGHWVVPWSFNL